MVTELAVRQDIEQRDPRLESVALQLFQSASSPQKVAVLCAIPTGTLANPAMSMTDIGKKSAQAISLVSTCTDALDRAGMATSGVARKGVSTQTSLTVLGREVVPSLIDAMQEYFEQTQTNQIFARIAGIQDLLPDILQALSGIAPLPQKGERRDRIQYAVDLPRTQVQNALKGFGWAEGDVFVLSERGVHLSHAVSKIWTAVISHKEEILERMGPMPLR